MVLPSSENTSDDCLSKEIRQKQRKEQTSSPECQNIKRRMTYQKLICCGNMAHNCVEVAISLLFFHTELPKTIQKTKPKVNVWFTTAVAKYLP